MRYESMVNKAEKLGLSKAASHNGRFYKVITDQTAFVLNLYREDSSVRVVYGVHSIARIKKDVADRRNFELNGVDDEDCTLRYMMTISDDAEEADAADKITDFFYMYHCIEKDDLLEIIKQRRKSFLKRIDSLLKPLGFKKKSNKWLYVLENAYEAVFHAQKSAFSDTYFFNFQVAPPYPKNTIGCYYTRVTCEDGALFDWQLTPECEMVRILNHFIENTIRPILTAPLADLGNAPFIWEHCGCKRDVCVNCWVKHNMHEAKELKKARYNRPYIICHMTTSIDGKVTGDFLTRPDSIKAAEVYYELNRTIKADGFACGRVTMEGSFTGGWYPDLDQYEPLKFDEMGLMNFMVDDMEPPYAVAFDPHGRLGWQSNGIVDPDGDPGYDNARIIEVLTEQVDLRYLTYLESMEIPYILAGETEIDMELALFNLRNVVGIKRLLLEGGSILNGAFQRAGVVDELSLVVDPVIAGKEGKPLFTDSVMDAYAFSEVHIHNGVLWLNYKKEAL